MPIRVRHNLRQVDLRRFLNRQTVHRLEQRFGRIHRIGQTEVCHLWNIVANETREGEVFQKLFDKIEIEKAALGGKVFDVLGEAFDNVSLKELLVQAIRYGDDPKVKAKMKELEKLGNGMSVKEKGVYTILEIVLEMYERGFKFLPIDLYKSHSNKFQIEDGAIRPPLSSIPGLGGVAAESIYNAVQAEHGKFMSIDDFQIKSKAGKSVIEMLTKFGCFEGMSKSNQLSLFG